MDLGGRWQNHLRAVPFKLYAKSLHIMSSSISVGMFIDCTTWASLEHRERGRRTPELMLSLYAAVTRNVAPFVPPVSSIPQTLCFAS
ncbi:hypothetical protein TIFTF001_031755 [Ficus carica]|uniref:Uncharacterized protein n=1 Tax=Ficus carica TaxID=3494 RepID=A0AA88DVQ1_FICCA|nr:hypothetical protein TIFTF001_031755 [Ficus carica]